MENVAVDEIDESDCDFFFQKLITANLSLGNRAISAIVIDGRCHPSLDDSE